jgi:hypothetical protein
VVTVPSGFIATAQTLTIDTAKTATVSGNVVTIYPGYTANQYTATVAKATSSVSGNVVTIPAGYHDATTKTIAEMAEPTVSANVVTIPVGYNKTQKTKTVAEAGQTTVSGNVVTTPVGYVKTERKNTVGTAKGAETITPGTADKTIAAGTYLTGALTVKGDANWTEENIAEGVSMWGKVGTHKGGGMEFFKCAAVYGPRKVTRIKVENAGTTAVNGEYEKTSLTNSNGGEVWKHLEADFYYYKYYDNWCIDANYNTYGEEALYYSWDGVSWNSGYNYGTGGETGTPPAPTVSKIQVTLDADVPKTWSGFKAVLTDGIYTFEESITAGLSYTAVTPVIDRGYTADALCEIKTLYNGIPIDGLAFYAPLTKASSTAETGQALIARNVTYETVDGIPCAYFDGSSGYTTPGIDVSQFVDGFTVSCFAQPADRGSHTTVFGRRNGTYSCQYRFKLGIQEISCWAAKSDVTADVYKSDIPEINKMTHAAWRYKDGKFDLFIGGELVASGNGTIGSQDSGDTQIATTFYSSIENYVGSLAALRLYNRALSDDEIKQLAKEFDV